MNDPNLSATIYRRALLQTMALAAVGVAVPDIRLRGLQETARWRADFPALTQQINGKPLAYLDSAATTLRPAAVIEAIADYYRTANANPSATLHTLARRSAERYAAARAEVARFINADPREIIWTRGTTEGINLFASSWGSRQPEARRRDRRLDRRALFELAAVARRGRTHRRAGEGVRRPRRWTVEPRRARRRPDVAHAVGGGQPCVERARLRQSDRRHRPPRAGGRRARAGRWRAVRAAPRRWT